MEEILASIRRIIADDDAAKPAKPPEAAAPKPAPPPPAAVAPPPAPPSARITPPPAAAANSQDDIDAMLAELEPAKPAPPKPAPAKAPPPKPAPAAVDVLDLTEAMAAPPPTPPPGPAPSFRTIDGASDVVFADRPVESEPPPPRAVEEPRRQPPPTPDRSLLSNSATAAVDSAFNTLAHTMLLNNARTLEDLVKEMLRPMLKSWLDDNLPGLVERIVRTEIERVSRGRP